MRQRQLPHYHRELYLTTHSTHNRQTSMPPAGFERTIPPGERLQTDALDRSATGIGLLLSQSHFVSLEALVVCDNFKIVQKLATQAFCTCFKASCSLAME
jgi:hypothetical protein